MIVLYHVIVYQSVGNIVIKVILKYLTDWLISYYATLYDLITKHIHVFHEALTKHSDHLPGGMHHDTPNAPKQEGSSGGTVSPRKMDNITIVL